MWERFWVSSKIFDKGCVGKSPEYLCTYGVVEVLALVQEIWVGLLSFNVSWPSR